MASNLKFGAKGLASFDLPSTRALSNASITQNSNNILFYDQKIWHFKTINLTKLLSEGGNVANSISSIEMDNPTLTH